jgi:hypothetical protein
MFPRMNGKGQGDVFCPNGLLRPFLPNAVLRKESKRPKVYEVTVDQPVVPAPHVKRLRAGLVITTDTVRQGKHLALSRGASV